MNIDWIMGWKIPALSEIPALTDDQKEYWNLLHRIFDPMPDWSEWIENLSEPAKDPITTNNSISFTVRDLYSFQQEYH